MTFAACTNENEEQIIRNGDKGTPENPVTVDFSAGITTRVAGNEWEAGDAIGISATDGADANYANVKYTVAEDGPSATFNVAGEASPICYTSDKAMSFEAYYPYAEDSEISEGKITRNTAQTQDKVDFLWASVSNKAYSENPKVNFTFQHKMAQINVKITSGMGDAINGKAVVIGGLKHDGSFDTTTGIAAPNTNVNAEDWTIGNANSEGFAYTGLIYPQNALSMTLKVGDDSDNLKATLNLGSIGKFNAGYKYTVTAIVEDGRINARITIDGNTIEDWIDGTGVTKVAFIGIANDINGLTDEAKAAATWLQNNISGSKYIPISKIADATEELSNYQMIWAHFDWTEDNTDNDNAINSINDKIKSYYENGGNILASRDATRFIGKWGITKDNSYPDNKWGGNGSVDYNRTLYCTIAHPIFEGLPISGGHCPLHEGADYTNSDRVLQWAISDVANWKSATGGIQLGADGGNSSTTVRMALFTSRSINDNNSGEAIVIGDPSFEWKNSNAESNPNHNNLTTLTSNIINYLIQ